MKRKVRTKKSSKKTTLMVVILLFAGVLAGLWLWNGVYNTSPEFYYIKIVKDGNPLTLLKGETILLHPKSRIHIFEISTNIYFNHGIRLVSKDIDVNALLYEDVLLSEFLPDKNILGKYSLRLNIKHINDDLGYVDLSVEPYVEDWLDKADRSIGYERKAEILEQALRLYPEDKKIRDQLIKVYTPLKRWEQAVLLLESAVNDRPDPETYYELLTVYEALSMTDQVIEVLEKLITLEPDNLDLRYRLAVILEETGHLKDSVIEYEAILDMADEQDRLAVYKALGFLYTETGKPDKAISVYLKAVEMDKNDVNLYHNLSLLYEKKGQVDKSNTYLMKAVELESGDMESRFKLVDGLITKGDLKEAEKHLLAVLKNDPRSKQAMLYMVTIAEKQGDKESLKKQYRNILAIEPGNEVVIYNLGILEYETGAFAKAFPYIEKYKKIHPEDVVVHTILFDIYEKLKKSDLAYGEALSITKLKPKDMDYYPYIFNYLFDRKKYNEIVKVIGNGVKEIPESIDLRKYLVLTYLKMAKEDSAITQLEEILKITPGDTVLLIQLGDLQEKQGGTASALNAVQKIINTSSEKGSSKNLYLKTLIEWARIKEKQDDLKGALTVYKEIIDKYPGHEEAEESYLRLRFQVLPNESNG